MPARVSRLGGASSIAAAVALLAVGCGGEQPPDTEFDSSIPEAFILNKARADVRSNAALLLEDPDDPVVSCSAEDRPGVPADSTAFRCDVRIVGADGTPLGRQTWEAIVELDSGSDDSVVRSTEVVESNIDSAPLP